MSNNQHELAQTACLRCREQKLKCSREQPSCARCAKTGALCSFPEPPDRKLIAVRRENDKRRAAESNIEDGSGSRSRNTRPRLTSSHMPRPTSANYSPESGGSEAVVQPEKLSDTLQQLLQDRYFSCILNSALTFHRPTFQREFQDGKIHTHTLLAMYALAVTLSTSESAFRDEDDSELRYLGDLTKLSETWAIQAGRTALQDIDQPTLSAVQTCQILTWYWFSKGDARRNSMFCGIAYKAIRTIVLDSEVPHPSVTGDSTQGSLSVKKQSIELESLRRCFWASWLTNCVNSDQYAIGSAADTQVLTMPLPISDHAFLNGLVEPFETLAKSQFRHDPRAQKLTTGPNQEPSIMAETVRITLLWARIRDHIEARRNNPNKESWCNTFLLQNDLTSWVQRLPRPLAYSKRNLYEQLIVKGRSIYTFLHAMYHQCCLMLHSSLVPYLSGSSLSSEGMPPEVARVSAEIALNHAQALSNLGADLLSLDWPPVQVAPFVGYSMYVAATVHLVILSRDSELAATARKHLASSLSLLKKMKTTWAILERLWSRIHRLYETQISKNGILSNGSTPAGASAISKQSGIASNLDGHQNQTGSTDELLKSTVSYFGLGRLRRVSPSAAQNHSNTSALDDTVSAVSEESMSQILELNGPNVGQSTSSETRQHPQETLTDNIQAQANVQTVGSALPAADELFLQKQMPVQVNEGVYGIPPSLDFAAVNDIISFDNWWQIDTNNINQVPYPFNDMFGMDLALQ